MKLPYDLRLDNQMNQEQLETFVSGLPNVERSENFGYSFFFVGDDHRMAFVTFANSDNEYDSVSNLDRDGVFRVNIGISKDTYGEIIAPSADETIDYSALNVFLPHPDYARQHYVCILNPAGDNLAETKRLIREAHAIAARRLQRRAKGE